MNADRLEELRSEDGSNYFLISKVIGKVLDWMGDPDIEPEDMQRLHEHCGCPYDLPLDDEKIKVCLFMKCSFKDIQCDFLVLSPAQAVQYSSVLDAHFEAVSAKHYDQAWLSFYSSTDNWVCGEEAIQIVDALERAAQHKRKDTEQQDDSTESHKRSKLS